MDGAASQCADASPRLRHRDGVHLRLQEPVATKVSASLSVTTRLSMKPAINSQRARPEMQPIVLIVENDEELQSLVEDALSESGYQPAITASAEEA